ncbi:MAG: fructosamine kinase family protein [Coriobacteriia bacterium]|nr:fructosamine kinase family protein [Coriobacteriia bacterium]
MQSQFVKRGTPRTASLLGEAAALRWLGEATDEGGMPVATVVSVTPFELVEQQVAPGAATAAAAERVGVALARTHAAGASWWGAPPTGWQGAYLIDHSETPTVPQAEAPTTWGAFFAEWRVRAYLRQAVDAGAIRPDETALVERVAARLEAGVYDAPQPGLLAASGTPVARIHGDLWSGNLLWTSDPGNPVGATLIDPMAHGGHAETDLAMLALFGCPHLDRIIAAYNEASPLAPGWRDRVQLHQLAPLLHHCALFGRSYVPQTLAVARAYA